MAACGPGGGFSDKFLNRSIIASPRVVTTVPAVTGDPWMQEFVEEFYADAQAKKHNVENDVVTVSFISVLPPDIFETNPSVVGFCSYNQNPNGSEYSRSISILQSTWKLMTWQTKRVLIYHELGHCALNLDHTPDGSGSIMDPYLLSDTQSQPDWMGLVDAEFASSGI
jgi:hypothetical protein